jgi:phenylacetate-CoA ligase
MEMTAEMLSRIKASAARAMGGEFYRKRFAGINPGDIKSRADFERLPFTEKEDLREAYPLGLRAVDEERIVRVHSSSGTTGKAVIIPYTRKDVDDWAIQFARCYEMAGITHSDRVQITPGYGLWTAGIGFQLGAERLGAMAIPMGPGNTERQIQMMIDLKSTVLCATSSYALLLAEEIERRGVRDKICLKKGVIGSERWGEKMRKRISEELGIELYDIYGLTEIYGPGIGISCKHDCGMHLWTDYFYFEIINPKTGGNAAAGETGEIVITTLQKEGAPLIRYRTRDLTREIPGPCPCGSPYPRIATIAGRSDDMVKVKGVMIFPSMVDELLAVIPGVSSEYRIEIDHVDGRDAMTLHFETTLSNTVDRQNLEKLVETRFREKINVTPKAIAAGMGGLPRSEKKSTRIIDKRE